jgi:hypothetical protein
MPKEGAKKGKGAKPAAADDAGDAAAEREPPATGMPDDVELPKVDPF